MASSQKVVRTDCEQAVPELCDGLKERGVNLVELPEFGTTEDELAEAVKGAEVILHCYTPITRRVLESAGPQLRAIVKYGGTSPTLVRSLKVTLSPSSPPFMPI